MVMSWAFLNLKPGVGKSTTAVFTGQAFYEENFKPLLVDADSGRSSLAAYNRAGGFPWPVVGMDEPDLHRKIPDIHGSVDVVLIDVPQLEDHARIARGAMRYADTWVLPVAPSHYEVDRMFEPPRGAPDDSGRSQLLELLAEVQEMRETPADVVVLLNRTNKSKRTKWGPDAEVRGVLEEKGFEVLDTVIPHHDDRFRQAITPRTPGTNTRRLVKELLDRRKQVLG
ncbi:hypothetical protein ABR737_43460 [Streptomyces sp. Edi2]|uniref:nucleotide-binding protein n=1 Tax=Streptomyces sp. Edi2 TaxID=3162528 RepID=UPI0033060E07